MAGHNKGLASGVSLFPGVQRSGPAVNGWFITFGDLLTLLLAFFLTIFSMSPLNPNAPKRSDAARNPATPGKTEVQPNQERKSGIPIALSPQKELPAQAVTAVESAVFFAGSDFGDGHGMLRSEALAQLKSFVVSLDYSRVRIVVESCGERGSLSSAGGIASAPDVQRALALRRQLIDAGVPRSALSLRTVGTHCELLGSSRDAVAKIEIRMNGN